MIERLQASSAPAEEIREEDADEDGDDMKLTSLQSITDFMTCAGRTLPDNIRLWARRNLAVARFPRGFTGRTPSRTESIIHYDERPVEEQLF